MNADGKSKNRKSKFLIGCQGWNYDDWITKAGGESVFYPRGTRSDAMLELYSEVFDTIEVDSTFYAIPPGSVIENWYRKTPANFTFSLKLPQEITHHFTLRKQSFEILDEFCERIRLLGEKLGVVLVQLPPNFEANKENARTLRGFLEQLPKDVRFAVEFRDRQWLVNWTFEELENKKAALCLVEGSWIPRDLMFQAIGKLENNFAYIRFMGERDLLSFDKTQRPQDANLQMWREETARLKARDIFVYFSNFYEGHAPKSVNKLKELLGHKITDPKALENQGSLF